MGWIIGIFIYLAIGYIFVLWAEAYEDGFWLQVTCMLIWSILAIAFAICFIYFGCEELYKKVKKSKK